MCGSFFESYAESYTAGYNAAKNGGKESDNPHKESGHPRDTTYDDELHYWWSSGFNDFEG